MHKDELLKIVVLNSKGGCGKTTLSTTLAARLARHGPPPTLVDCDPQGFAMRWLEKRSRDRRRIHGLAAYEHAARARSLREQVPEDSTIAIIDLPASLPHRDLYDFTYIADKVLIPIMPSEIDIFSASRLVAELLLDAQLDRRDNKLGIVANRVRHSTRSYRQLQRFLGTLQIPLVATLRDTQNFVLAASLGLGITELPPHLVQADTVHIEAIVNWLGRAAPDEAGRAQPAAHEPNAAAGELSALGSVS